MYLNE